MTPPNGDGPPLRFSLGIMGEGLFLRNTGPRSCQSQTCQESTEINSFGPGISLGLATTRRGFLFDARVSAAYHWGSYSQRTENRSGLPVNEISDSEGLYSVGAQIGLGVNFLSAALYVFGNFLYAGANASQISGYSFGPGIGVSFGPNRVVTIEGVYFPFFKREGFPDDHGDGFAVRASFDFMALLNRSRPRPVEENQITVTSLRLPPEQIPREEIPQQVEHPAEVRIEGDLIYYVGNINFDYNSAVIRTDDNSLPTLDLVAAFLHQNPQIRRVEIHGHTDDRGPEPYNATLSLRRASAVRRALIQRGVEAYRVTAVGHGETQPLVQNNTDAGRALNRRVEFRIRERRP